MSLRRIFHLSVVEPHVQKRLLLDLLKGNHLGINALKLIKYLPSIEAIWEKRF